jgi:hypothetical protein
MMEQQEMEQLGFHAEYTCSDHVSTPLFVPTFGLNNPPPQLILLESIIIHHPIASVAANQPHSRDAFTLRFQWINKHKAFLSLKDLWQGL